MVNVNSQGQIVRKVAIIGTYHNIIGYKWEVVRDTYHRPIYPEKPSEATQVTE